MQGFHLNWVIVFFRELDIDIDMHTHLYKHIHERPSAFMMITFEKLSWTDKSRNWRRHNKIDGHVAYHLKHSVIESVINIGKGEYPF